LLEISMKNIKMKWNCHLLAFSYYFLIFDSCFNIYT
jgi:hypothetical protein